MKHKDLKIFFALDLFNVFSQNKDPTIFILRRASPGLNSSLHT